MTEHVSARFKDTAKVKDLAKNTWDCSSSSGQTVMTTDHGTAIVNPDTW